MYEERTYRRMMQSEGLKNFTVVEGESDLHISANGNLEKIARCALLNTRRQLSEYIKLHPDFQRSLVPISVDAMAPPIVHRMAKAAKIANVGPMAAVAGAVAEAVGNSLLQHSSEILVENGGDLFIRSEKTKKVLIHAGDSPFSEKLALSIKPSSFPLGICTSSGKIGHSLSFGNADGVVAISQNICLADAAATAIANRVKSSDDIKNALSWGKALPGICGLLIIIDDQLGTWGDLILTRP